MNKRLYRIVFNRCRGLLMAVAETTVSQGKAVGTTPSARGPRSTRAVGCPSALVSSLWLAGLVWWVPVPAQIVADPTAPGPQRPTVLTAPNGTPLVNIQTPSAAGVSRNTYRQFDVNRQGAILNNSRTHTQTQLGGWVQGNPWLATGSARVILNEVNSAHPSHLRGPIEVAGQRAEVVIANPAGIQVNGGGFLNASRVTLTTGTPIVSGGALDGFRVTQGQIRIEGAGLDASQADHAALLARAVQVNAGIWARELTVSTGAQQASASDADAAASTPIQGTGPAPGVTLDVAQLGGMYAGKIVLVGTEAGLGVRNAGVIAATTGSLVVRADGWLDNRGHMQAQGDVAVNTSGAVSNSGSLYAHGQASIEGRSGIVQTAGGTMAAGGTLALRATADGAQVTTQTGSVLAAGMDPQGRLAAPGQLTVQATHAAQLQGQALAGRQVSVAAAQVSLAEGRIGARQIQVHATDGDLDAPGATLAAEGPLSLNASRNLRTDAALVSAESLDLQARHLSNVGGELVQVGGSDLALRFDGGIDNREGRIAAASRNLQLQADHLLNVHGRIEHAGDGTLSLRARTIDGSHGLVAAAHGADIQVDTLTHEGAVLQAHRIDLHAQDLSNRGGHIALSGTAPSQLVVSNGFDNTGGSLAANGRLDVAAGSIRNAQGSITALDTLTAQSTGLFDNAGGQLAAGGSLRLDGAEIANTGGRVQAGGNLQLQAERFTHSGHVVAGGDIEARAAHIHATATSVTAAGVPVDGSVPSPANAGHLRITASDTLVAQGRQIAAAQAHLEGANIDLSGGQTTAQHIQMRAAGAIVTDGATVSTPGRLFIAGRSAAHAAALSNVQGVLNAGQLELGVNRIDNTRGEIVQTGSIDTVIAVADGIDNSQGRIAARGDHLAIQASAVVNRGGSIEHHGGGTLALNAGSFEGQGGQIFARSALDLQASAVQHDGALIEAENLHIRTGTLSNRGGAIVQVGTGPAHLAVQGRLDNAQGTIAGQGALTLSAGTLHNEAGRVTVAQNLAVEAGTLANTGTLYAGRDLQLTASGGLENGGILAARRHAEVLAGELRQGASGLLAAGLGHDGRLEGDGHLSVHTAQALTSQGQMIASGAVSLEGAQLDLRGGQVHGTDVSLIAADGTLDTRGAFVTTTGRLQLAARGEEGLVNAGGTLSASRLVVDAARIDNTRGEIVQTGTDDLSLQATTLDNTEGRIASASAALRIQAHTLVNAAGRIEHAGRQSLQIEAHTLDNTAGRILSRDIALLADTLNNTRGAVHATSGALTIDAAELRNLHGGQLHAAQALALDARRLDHAGSLRSGTALEVTVAEELANAGLIAAQDIRLAAGTLNNTGDIDAAEALRLQAAQAHNAGLLYAGASQTLASDEALSNNGVIAARGALTLNAGRVDSAATGLLAAGLERNGSLTGSAALALSARQDLQVQGPVLASGTATLRGASVDLSHADVRAADLHLQATQAGVRTHDASIVATGALRIDTPGSLDNTAGLLAGRQIHLDTLTLDNRSGEIVHTGSTEARFRVSASLDNRGGRIALNADEARLWAPTLLNTNGRIEHAGTQALHIEASALQGEQGHIESNAQLAMNVEGAARLDGAQTVARQLTIDAGSLSHRNAVMLQTGTQQASVTAASAIDNTGGTVSSNGALTLQAQALTNVSGTVATADARQLDLTVDGTLDNRLGQIAAGGNAELHIGRIDNTSGRLTAGQSLSIAARQDVHNHAGVIAARSNVLVSADAVNNTQGTLASVESGVHALAAGLVQNDAGRIEAAGAVTLQAAGLRNTATGQAQARIVGQTLQIDTLGQALDNTGGTLAARADAVLETGALDNTVGLVQAGGRLHIDTHGHELINAFTNGNSDTGLVSGGAMNVHTGALDNHAGFIGAVGHLTVRSQAVTNTGNAHVLARSSLDLQATRLDNRAGQVQAAGSMTLDLGGGTLDNRGSLLRAGQTLSITAGTIDNRDTLGSDQGLEATELHLAATTLRNASGALRADGSLSVASRGSIDNTGGLITSLGEVALIDTQADRTLSLSNDGGTISAGQSLQIQADRLTGTGRIVSGGNASVALDASLAHAGEMAAANNLQLTLGGSLDNSGRIEAGGQLQLHAAGLDNRASGEIIGQNARIDVAGALTNRGLIDGASVHVQANTLHNLGSGRLYGDHLALQAGTLTNDTETLDGVRADAVIAARERLDIGASTLTNREHALLFSAGDMALGGALDANRQATGSASLIHNASATIEALGNLDVATSLLRNTNEHVEIGYQASEPIRRVIHQVGSAEYDNTEVAYTRYRGQRQNQNLYLVPDQQFFEQNRPLGEVGDKYLLLPSDRYPLHTFGPAGALDRVPLAAYEPASVGVSHDSTYEIPEVYRYDRANPLWDLFGVPRPDSDPPAAPAPDCSGHPSGCHTQQQVYEDWKRRNHALYLQLNAAIDAFAADVARRRVGNWTYLRVEETQINPVLLHSDPAQIRVGGHARLTGHTINEGSHIFVGGTLSGDASAIDNRAIEATATTTRSGHAVRTWRESTSWSGTDRNYAYTPYEVRENRTVSVGSAEIRIAAPMSTHTAVPERAERPLLVTPSSSTTPSLSLTPRPVITEVPSVTTVQAVSRAALSAAAVGGSLPLPGAIATAPAGELGQVPDVGSPGAGGPGTPSAQPGASASETVQALARGAQAVTGVEVNRLVPAGESPATVDGAPQTVIRTVTLPVSLPTSSLFRPQPEPGARYLIETDPRFTNHRQWLGSDYLLQQLQADPATTHKRLGDGFYEQRLVAEQVAQLTGRRFLDGHADDEAQMRALMDAGLTFAHEHALRPGIALTPEQMAALTSDIIWLVEREVSLPDGTRQTVLVPQVYVRVQPGDLDGTGTLLSADRLELDLTGDFTNSGTVAGRTALAITAENVKNLGGRLTAQSVDVHARQDLDTLGGLIDAGSRLSVSAGRDLTVASTTASTATQAGPNLFERTTLDRVAGLYVSEAGATLLASAGRDLVLQAAQVNHAGAGGTTVLAAGRDLTLGTVATSQADQLQWNRRNWLHTGQQQDVGTQIQATGDVALLAGRDLSARAATVSSEHGGVLAQAGRDLTVDAGQARQSYEQASHIKSSGFLRKKTTTTHDHVEQTQALGSTFSAETVDLLAARDLTVRGSDVVSSTGTTLAAGRDVTIEAAAESVSEQHFKDTRRSGVFTSGASLTIGKQRHSTDAALENTTARGATVGSVQGHVLLQAGGAYRQTGSDVLAPGGDVTVAASSILIEGAQEARQFEQTTKFRQSGLTVAVSSPVISAAQGVAQMGEAGSQTGDPRLQALAAGSAALSVREATQALSQSPQTGGGFSVSITVGGSKSESQLTQSASTTRASAIEAGGNVKLIAAGAGEDSHLTLRGSDVNAAGHATLMAEGDVVLQSQAQSAQQHSTHRSSSAGVGLALTYGQNGWAAGFTANASAARGHADGTDLTHRHTEVSAGRSATLLSGRDTTLSGAQVSSERIVAKVGGDLTIQSVQDTATYDSRHQSAGGSVTIGYGFAASASYSQARVDADHASVSQHSGLRAGDGGFDVQVQGHTALQGGLIASTQAAVDEGRNRLATGTLSTQDITNRSEHEARGLSVSGGFSYGGSGKAGSSEGGSTGSPSSTRAPAQPSSGVALQQFQTQSQGAAAGYVSDSSSRTSTTRSGISGGEIVITDAAAQQERTGQTAEQALAAVNREVLSGTGANGLSQRWEGQALQKEVQAGARIVESFGRQASKAVGDYAGRQEKSLKEQARQAPTEAERQALLAEADKWAEGGAYRVAAHIAVGGLSGGLEGALGSGSSAAAADALNELTAELPQGVRQAVGAGIAAGLGALTGGPTGAATAFNAEMNNRQLHPSESQWIKDNAKRFAQHHGITEQEAEQRLAQQAFRQVQFGAEGTEDAQARAFLSQAHGMLPTDPACPTCGPGYMFYATPEQRANAGMYAGTLGQTDGFYQANGLTQPTLQQIINAASNDSTQRNTIAQQTVLAAVTAGTLALAPSLSGVATEAAAFARNPVQYCLGNPAACTVAAETAAYTAAGVPQPGSGVPSAKAVTSGTNSAGRTGTVFDSITATQPVYPGSAIPRSFEMTLPNGQRVWVAGNATEHMAEFAQMKAVNHTPEAVRLASQQQLSSLQGAVNTATQNGITYNQLMTVGGWELKFAPPRQLGQLPSIIHALPTGK